MKITYKGKPNYRLEKTIETILSLFQYEFIGSGYNIEEDERDIKYEIIHRKSVNLGGKKLPEDNQKFINNTTNI